MVATSRFGESHSLNFGLSQACCSTSAAAARTPNESERMACNLPWACEKAKHVIVSLTTTATGLDGVAERGLNVALWRGVAGVCFPRQRARTYSSPVIGSTSVLVALHAEGLGVVLVPGADDEERMELAVPTAAIVPTSSRYHLAA